ncbi:hypothetical protein Q0601_23150 [Paracoccus onubensis]|uniref:hypothetical protein n=1 Tax=Paracoccus onubensis TaxID=1675788 RepID=UPI0027320842|nr:hypothetical protein [Paracoccus onubensis]MDP0930085.1 hypothetical protein [Paracoccus onubensis]
MACRWLLRFASFIAQTFSHDHFLIRVEGTVISPDATKAAIAATEAQIRAALERAA